MPFKQNDQLPQYVSAHTHRPSSERPKSTKMVRNNSSFGSSPHAPVISSPGKPPKRFNVVFFLVAGMFSVYCLMILAFAWPFLKSSSLVTGEKDVRILYNLIDMQNRTIHSMVQKVKSFPYLLNFYESRKNDDSIQPSRVEINRLAHLTETERECESRYGLQLADDWRRTEEVWCQSKEESPKVASLKCYPYQQKHRLDRGKGKDMFCVAENFVIDFSLLFGDIAQEGVKVFYQFAYLDILSNVALQAGCQRTEAYAPDLFGAHTRKFFDNFQDNVAVPEFQVYEEKPTYFLPRDEDCENAFHSQADFLNMFLVHQALETDLADQQVLLMDKMPNTPFNELLHRVFAPVHGVHRHTRYGGDRVMFKKLIFHLESPAALVFPETATKAPQRCREASLFDAYRRHVLEAFRLLHVPAPIVPTAALIVRRRTLLKNVGRVLANEDAVLDAVRRQGHVMKLQIIDLASMSYQEQLTRIRQSNILIGVHGAGLTSIMFAADEAVLMEIHPSYREDRHFRHLARLTGKDYLPMRSLTRETCFQTSDAVTVDISEFLATLNGAVRLARSYDAGTLECGLDCAPALVARDAVVMQHLRNDSDGWLNVQRYPTTGTPPLDRTFPCVVPV